MGLSVFHKGSSRPDCKGGQCRFSRLHNVLRQVQGIYGRRSRYLQGRGHSRETPLSHWCLLLDLGRPKRNVNGNQMYESEVMEMKLKSEIPFIRESFNKITNLPEYAVSLKANGNYKNFGTRLAWDCIHATIPSEIVCGWYDDHITTAAKSVLREMGVL